MKTEKQIGLSSVEWAAYYGLMHRATFQAMADASENVKEASWTRIARVLGCANQFVAHNLYYWMA